MSALTDEAISHETGVEVHITVAFRKSHSVNNNIINLYYTEHDDRRVYSHVVCVFHHDSMSGPRRHAAVLGPTLVLPSGGLAGRGVVVIQPLVWLHVHWHWSSEEQLAPLGR